MIASPAVYWTMVGLAVAVYLGTNAFFLIAMRPPIRPGFRRLYRTMIGHWLPQMPVLTGLLLLTQMAAASLLLVSTLLILTLMANNKKYAMLNEPLLPSDLAMTLRQLHVWHVLGEYVRRDLAVLVGLPTAAAATVAIAVCEPCLLGRYFLTLALLSPLPVWIFFPLRGKSPILRFFKLLHVPFQDWDICNSVTMGGFFPTFLRLMNNVPQPAVRTMTAAIAGSVLDQKFGRGDLCRRPERLPNIVVVLAEAFADPRAMGIFVEPNPLTNYDEAVRRSLYSGRTWVQCYGGWTVRSEYSFLTGINLAAFSNNIGNPNTTLVAPPMHSLPKHLRSLGYRTLLMHPHNGRFYGRDNAAAPLGFDAFLDERSFADAPREGKYIADAAVASRIELELQQAEQPTFLFCITMENHGPWDDKTPPETAPFTVRPELSPVNHLRFAHYLRHLRNADLMIGRLANLVAAADAPTIVLVFGDHLPGLTDLFREVGCAMFTKGVGWAATACYMQTPFFLLSNMPGERQEMNCDISFLPGLLLDCAGLNGDAFFRHNSAMRRHQKGNIYDNSDSVARDAYLRMSYEIATFPERYAKAS
jgi:hypothetical protein